MDNNNCNCKEKIRHPYGNPLRIAIEMTLETMSGSADNISVLDEPFIPGGPVRVLLHNGARHHSYDAEVTGNVATILDESKLPIGVYAMELLTVGQDGLPYRCKYRNVLTVVDYSEDAGILQPIEFRLKTSHLKATFIAAGGGFVSETDPTVPKHVKAISQQDIARWNAKQDEIKDLDLIRSRLQYAVQDANYVHTDNNYSDSEKGKISDLQDRVSELESSSGGGGIHATYDPVNERIIFPQGSAVVVNERLIITT